ncbi:MAG: TetR/AcrR family transcriptional regulator C-terminal domain-containing protein [Oscillospiraceae bacterium]|nr:TetR/AcrR family transcriptional regulator C-terminal domain-containing protein [Oscillospiraceae bacterium]
MKHEVTSYNTKKLLVQALKNRMKSKPLSKISVSEIIAECGVNRKTFYYHFADVNALLKWMFEQETINVVKQFNLLVDYEDAIRFVMKYVEENEHIVQCVVDSMGRIELKKFFYADFSSVIEAYIEGAVQENNLQVEQEYKNFVIAFYTEALAGALISWIEDKDNLDREKSIAYMVAVLKGSLPNVFIYGQGGSQQKEK